MKMLKAALGTLCATVSIAANAALIDFDTLPGGASLAAGSAITNQYQSLGIVFSGWENGSQVSLTTSNVYSPTFGNYLGNSADGTAFPSLRWDEIRMDFTSPVENVAFKLFTHGSLSVTFNAYDDSNQLLETITMTSGPWGDVFFNSSGISRISGLQPNDNWYWAMDQVSFDTSATSVPEPASLALFGLGMAALGFSRRKRKA